MSPSENRRYTDREVALVLKRAAELEERKHRDGGGRGLTRRELHDIGREVGLSDDVLNHALEELQRGGVALNVSLLGPPPSTKVARAVPGTLTETSLQKLVQLVEDRSGTTGTVTEALGSVRWTSVPHGGRVNQTTQVAFTPSSGETQIQVTHRFAPKFRTVLHLLPAMWGGMIGVAVAASAGAVTLPFIGVIGGAAVVGGVVGRGVWHLIARRAYDRADSMANEIAAVAADLSERDPDA